MHEHEYMIHERLRTEHENYLLFSMFKNHLLRSCETSIINITMQASLVWILNCINRNPRTNIEALRWVHNSTQKYIGKKFNRFLLEKYNATI